VGLIERREPLVNKHIEREIMMLTRERKNIDIAIADFERLEAKDPGSTPSRSGNLIQMKTKPEER
jgi:hypothetical protein